MAKAGSGMSSEDRPSLPETKPNDGRPYLMLLINEEGKIEVKGWLHDKILAYGLLESARDAIKDAMDKEVKIQRVNGSGGLLRNLRNGFRGTS